MIQTDLLNRLKLPIPADITAIGLGVTYLKILWQRHEIGISARLQGLLPRPLHALVERRL